MIANLELPLGRHIGDVLALESVPIDDLIELGWRAAFWMRVENSSEWGRHSALDLVSREVM